MGVNLHPVSTFLIHDDHPSYSPRDEFAKEGRAMSNAMLGVRLLLPRPALPNGREGFTGLSVPIA